MLLPIPKLDKSDVRPLHLPVLVQAPDPKAAWSDGAGRADPFCWKLHRRLWRLA